MTHEWHSTSTEPEIDGYQHVSFDEVPISMVRSLRGEVVAVTDTDSLGDEWAADRAFMEANGIRSLLELPDGARRADDGQRRLRLARAAPPPGPART